MRLQPESAFHVAPERDRAEDETSEEPFDRVAFARYALALVRPVRTTVAICEDSARMRLLSGRVWGTQPMERWAMLAVGANASKRAIALAVAELADAPRAYVLDVLLAEAFGNPIPHQARTTP